MIGEEILMEIGTTLDQLIRNAEVIQNVELKDLSENELEAFQKTQESLLQHLMHMDQILEIKRKTLRVPDKRSSGFKIQGKLLKFEKMKTDYHKNISEQAVFGRVPFLSKRRSKKFL